MPQQRNFSKFDPGGNSCCAHEWMIGYHALRHARRSRLSLRPSVLSRPVPIRSISSVDDFSPRRSFPVPARNPFTWFPGHMLAGLRALAQTITDIDLIVETRDARIPLSSRNPYLEDVCANKRRLVLYNKRDLAGLTKVQEDVGNPLSGPES